MSKPEKPEKPTRKIWCAEHSPAAGPFTEAELRIHNSPTGVHANMYANGSGPGPSYRGRKS